MQALQSQALLSSDSHAMDQLHDFLRRRRETGEPVEDFDRFEQDLHRLFVVAEREALGHELARFDLDVPQVEVAGEPEEVFEFLTGTPDARTDGLRVRGSREAVRRLRTLTTRSPLAETRSG